MGETETDFSQDLLRGADAIAQFLYGNRELGGAIYYLAASPEFPHFQLGSMLCARKSELEKWIKEQEERRGGRACNPNAAPGGNDRDS
jgi:hypothetical protein